MPRKQPVVKVVTKRTRTPDFAEWPDWSEAKFFGYLRSKLRSGWQRFPSRYKVLADAKRPYKGSNKQQKWEFLCAVCGKYHPQSNVEVDHITPAGSLKTFDDLPDFCRRLFVGPDKLRVLCKPCHKTITRSQGEQ